VLAEFRRTKRKSGRSIAEVNPVSYQLERAEFGIFHLHQTVEELHLRVLENFGEIIDRRAGHISRLQLGEPILARLGLGDLG
jgi:hypothetical protein